MKIILILLMSILLTLNGYSTIWAQLDLDPDYVKQDMAGKFVEADMMQKKVLRYYENKYGVNSLETLKFIEALAWMNMELQDYREAGLYYSQAIDIRENKMPASGENTKKLSVAYFMLADSHLYRKYYLEAETYFDKSFNLTIDPAHHGDVLSRKGIIHEGQENYERSIEFYLEAIKKYDTAKNRNPQNRNLINKRILVAYSALVELYKRTDQPDEVKKYLDLKTFTERALGI